MPRQRFACLFDTDACTIDQIQLAVLTQQVVQVQVFLPQTLAVHLPDGSQSLGKYGHLFISQHRQRRDCIPGIAQALSALQVLEQQPAPLTFLQAIGQQLRRGQALFSQQTHPGQLALKVARSLVADHHLGQHGTPAPHPGTDITLARQYPQQGQQLQLRRPCCVGQFDTQRQAWRTASLQQFGQTHQRPPF